MDPLESYSGSLARTLAIRRLVWIFPSIFFLMTHSYADPLVIAHRGASGYLPEHTLEAKALAVGMGAGAIEQDVVLTRDGIFIVLHDIHLDTVTDVATVFPGRAREDGRFYAIDFTFAEIRRLKVSERFERDMGAAVYPGRFPVKAGYFRIPSLEMEIQLIRGLESSLGREIPIYVEFKAPAWHRAEGQPMEEALHRLFNQYGYTKRESPCWVQCFDPEGLKRLRRLGSDLKQVQLIGSNDWNEADVDYEALITPKGLKRIAEYADGVGPWLRYCYTMREGRPEPTPFVEALKDAGLILHPFTFRADAFPSEDFAGFKEMVRFFVREVGVDGLFTDHPDRVLEVLEDAGSGSGGR